MGRMKLRTRATAQIGPAATRDAGRGRTSTRRLAGWTKAGGVAGLVLLAACQSAPPPRRAAPPPRAPAPEGEVIFHAPAKKTPMAPVRREPAYEPGELPDRLALGEAEWRAMRGEVGRWLGAAILPEGEELKLYARGVATLDHWLHYSSLSLAEPPASASWYEMIYRGGRPLEAYRHDEQGRRLVQKIYYSHDAEPVPVLSVHYGKDGAPTRYNHLTYDYQGLIKRVVVFDPSGRLLRVRCRLHRTPYMDGEAVTYNFMRGGEAGVRTVYEDSRIYLVEGGERRLVNIGSTLRTITSLRSFGVLPFYPLPEGFVMPEDLEPWHKDRAAGRAAAWAITKKREDGAGTGAEP